MKILISDAVTHFGTKAALAAFLDVTPQAIQRWKGNDPENPKLFMPVEQAKKLVERMPACKQYVQEDVPPPTGDTPIWP